ncbi:MAG: tetratricopeptide repeat protein [Chloroflexi bacterium]|nr:tetratricopeptide repeat protein [Chloroflexota bacterium]
MNDSQWSPSESPMQAFPEPRRRSLPAQLPQFFGREAELEDIQRLLGEPDCRLLTLVGPGGIGKTRLAIEAARQMQAAFADGVVFVDLQPLSAAEHIPSTIANQLNLPLTGASPSDIQLAAFLRSRQALLVIDNFEHLLEGADLLAMLLQYAPQLKILVTSREALNLQEEWIFPVEGLTYPNGELEGEGLPVIEDYSAVRLLAARIRRVRPEFSIEEEKESIVRICRLVEGMPLALELAAVWARVLRCDEIAQEIENNLQFLSSGLRNIPERHRSLEAVFEQSMRLLDERERDVFKQLSVFRGGFSREAVEQVTGSTLSVLSSLVDKSLLRREHERHSLHQLLRQFAEQLLDQQPEQAAQVRDRHCAYFTQFLRDRQVAVTLGGNQAVIFEIRSEIENLRAAWNWALSQGRLQELRFLALVLDPFFQYQSWFTEAAEMLEGGIQALENMSPAGSHAQNTQKPPDTRYVRAQMLASLVWFYTRLGRIEKAREAAEKSHRLYTELDAAPPTGLGSEPLAGIGMTALLQGRYTEALDYAERTRQVSEARGDGLNHAFAHYLMSSAHLRLGNFEQARENGRIAYEIASKNNALWFSAYCLNEWGSAARAMKDYDEARKQFQASYTIRESFNDPEGMAVALNHLGEIANLQQNFDEAMQIFQRSIQTYRTINDRGGLATAMLGMGVAACGQGKRSEAQNYLREALQTADEIQFIPLILSVLTWAAELFARNGQHHQAVEILAFVQNHPGEDRETRDQARKLMDAAREILGEDEITFISEHARWRELEDVVHETLILLSMPLAPVLPDLEQVTEAKSTPQEPALEDNDLMIEPLSERELEVLRCMAEGLKNQEIANRLYLSLGTVKWYTSRLFDKLGVNTRSKAVARAREKQLI